MTDGDGEKRMSFIGEEDVLRADGWRKEGLKWKAVHSRDAFFWVSLCPPRLINNKRECWLDVNYSIQAMESRQLVKGLLTSRKESFLAGSAVKRFGGKWERASNGRSSLNDVSSRWNSLKRIGFLWKTLKNCFENIFSSFQSYASQNHLRSYQVIRHWSMTSTPPQEISPEKSKWSSKSTQ